MSDHAVHLTPEVGIRLQGDVALVTGAGQAATDAEAIGTGAATARLLAKAGASVVIVDRDESAAWRTADAISADGGRALVAVADVSVRGDCQRAVDLSLAAFGSIDILVNNAAVTSQVGLMDMTDREWSRVLDINLKGAAMMSQSCIAPMRSQGRGAIVNVASVAALRGFSTPAYAAAKGGLLALTADLAVACGPDGIRVNAIAPGHVYTPMVRRGDQSDLGRRLRRAANPLGTEGRGWDVAWAALFLAGPEARWITGATLPVDGGLLVAAPLPMFAGLQAVHSQFDTREKLNSSSDRLHGREARNA